MRSPDANEILRTSGIDALRNAIDNGAEDDRKSSTAGIERKKDRTVKAAVKQPTAELATHEIIPAAVQTALNSCRSHVAAKGADIPVIFERDAAIVFQSFGGRVGHSLWEAVKEELYDIAYSGGLDDATAQKLLDAALAKPYDPDNAIDNPPPTVADSIDVAATPSPDDYGTVATPSPAASTGRSLVAFPMVAFGDIKLDRTATGYLVKNLLSSTGLAVVWGPPKCGKSFWVMDLALHIAKGWPYRGKRVRQCPVIYFVLEGRSALPKRIEAMKRHYRIEDAPLYLITKQLDLIKQCDAVIASIRAQIELNPGPQPGLIALYTLNRSLMGSESKDEDMGAYLAAADRIAEAFKCLVIIVHHCGIDLSRPRGHTSLTGAVDTQIAVKRGPIRENMEFVASIEFVKDGQEGEEIWSLLERLEMGADDEGDEIASMVVQPIDSTGRKSMPAQRLSARQQLALDCLHECLAASTERAPAAYGIGSNIIVTTEDAWREECLSRGAIPRDGKNPRADFIRVREALQRRVIIGYK
jgi:hypothetical protein